MASHGEHREQPNPDGAKHPVRKLRQVLASVIPRQGERNQQGERDRKRPTKSATLPPRNHEGAVEDLGYLEPGRHVLKVSTTSRLALRRTPLFRGTVDSSSGRLISRAGMLSCLTAINAWSKVRLDNSSTS